LTQVGSTLFSRILLVGFGNSPLFLEQSRVGALDNILQVAYQQGDMRTLPWTAHFDRIINWFTSYGYFDDEDNRQVLREAYRALKPGGKLLIDHQNRDRWLQSMPTHVVFEHPHAPGDFMIDQVSYDVLTGRHETERTVTRAGQTRKMHFSVRLFTFPELRDWLFQAGFSGVEGNGADGEPLRLESRRMIVVASKA
jgi:SAM-dependent methyltransferase